MGALDVKRQEEGTRLPEFKRTGSISTHWHMAWQQHEKHEHEQGAMGNGVRVARWEDGQGVDDFLVAWRLAGWGMAPPPRACARHFLGMERALTPGAHRLPGVGSQAPAPPPQGASGTTSTPSSGLVHHHKQK